MKIAQRRTRIILLFVALALGLAALAFIPRHSSARAESSCPSISDVKPVRNAQATKVTQTVRAELSVGGEAKKITCDDIIDMGDSAQATVIVYYNGYTKYDYEYLPSPNGSWVKASMTVCPFVRVETVGVYDDRYIGGNEYFAPSGDSVTLELTRSVTEIKVTGYTVSCQYTGSALVTSDIKVFEYTLTLVRPSDLKAETSSGTDAPGQHYAQAFFSGGSCAVSRNGGAYAPYSYGARLTEEGTYTFKNTMPLSKYTDTKTVIVDRTPPRLTYSDRTEGKEKYTNKAYETVEWSVGRYESEVTATYTHAGVDGKNSSGAYSSGQRLTEEGTYTVTATDKAGNSSSVKITVDRTPPEITYIARGSVFEKYTNAPFVARTSDVTSGVETTEIYSGGRYIPYDGGQRSANGEYMFRVTDKAGNVAMGTAVVYKTDTFGNVAAIRDGYKVNSWYTVALPPRIFTTPDKDVSGKYSFERYADALEFALKNEREFRVRKVAGGYMYISAANETIVQKYDTEASVMAVAEKYAKGYISARQTSSERGGDRYYTENVSLTRNSPAPPEHVRASHGGLKSYFIRSDTLFGLPSIAYINGMPYSVTAKYLGDLEEDRTQAAFTIERGKTLEQSAREYRQGWYELTERDGAGNVEQYLVYSDSEPPHLSAVAEYGDGKSAAEISYDYTVTRSPYYISLALERLSDNADPYITLKLDHGGKSLYYTQTDALPTLGADEFGAGKYTITVYDRSGNRLKFDAFIADAPPTMVHGSLESDRPDCKISFVTSDKFNVITDLTLFKIEHDGTRTVLEADGAGVPITPITLDYTLTVGGKYGATLIDNYRRTVDVDPIFFLKGLPRGVLYGVANGKRTNKNVSFTFSSVDECELYTLHEGGERRPFTDYTVQTSSAKTTFDITAGENTSHEYLVFLHAAHDKSLYVEYTFEIDTALPELEIFCADGSAIQPDGATNKPFRIAWSDSAATLRYRTARGGAMSYTRYTVNTVLDGAALYYFVFSDDVGNELEFTVLLDNAVDYTIGGKYNKIDGVLYANAPLSFTVNEPTTVFDVANADGYSVENGGTLTQAGRYELTATDNYGNTVELVIVLDFAPPVLELSGVESGGAGKTEVKVTASDYDYLYLSDRLGNKLKDIDNGATFSDAGRYYITASDLAGNTVTVTFAIDLTVDYALSVPNGAVTTRAVTLESLERLTVNAVKDGAPYLSATRFVDSGIYELSLTDAIGNSVSCVFVIVPTRVRALGIPLPLGTRIVRATRNGEPYELADATALALDTSGVYVVMLDCGGVPFELELEVDNTPPVVTIQKNGNTVTLAGADKENVELKLTLDGKDINCRVGQKFEDPGHYVLTATDELGNVAIVEWDIPFRLNTWAIVAICVGGVVLLVVLVLVIRARRKPRLK